MQSSVLSVSEFMSIGFGFSGIILAAITVYHYWPKARLFMSKPESRDFAGWLSLGIFVGFVASFLDSSYWQMAWISDYMSLPPRDAFFKYGVMANIPFRNIALIFAAYCHYRAILIVLPNRKAREAGYVTLVSLAFGFFCAFVLMLIKS